MKQTPRKPCGRQHTKNVPGRKSDVQECQWLLKLHAFGVLNNSLQPSDEIRVARSLWRHRGDLVAEAGSAVQRMQKALTEMNVQLSNVLKQYNQTVVPLTSGYGNSIGALDR
jgi:hypothetical protein